MHSWDSAQSHLSNNPHQWLVTGCAGFIGSHLVETLLSLGQKVVGIDNFLTGHKKNIDLVLAKTPSAGQKNFLFTEGDICNLDLMNQLMKGCDFVLHQAALGSVPRSFKEPLNTHRNNVTGFLNMIEAARSQRPRQIVYASSSSVYGSEKTLPKIEDKIGQPLSPYAASKLFNEIYADIFRQSDHLGLIGLRYFNVFGPRQDPEGVYAAVIPRWFTQTLAGQAVEIYGDGETSRDFCFVQNAVQANILAAINGNSSTSGQIFNVACGERTSLNQLITSIQKLALSTQPQLQIKKPIHKDFRPGDVQHSLADISKATNLIGYKPTHNISQGLSASLNWYAKDC